LLAYSEVLRASSEASSGCGWSNVTCEGTTACVVGPADGGGAAVADCDSVTDAEWLAHPKQTTPKRTKPAAREIREDMDHPWLNPSRLPADRRPKVYPSAFPIQIKIKYGLNRHDAKTPRNSRRVAQSKTRAHAKALRRKEENPVRFFPSSAPLRLCVRLFLLGILASWRFNRL
jgi:hypothetical protein